MAQIIIQEDLAIDLLKAYVKSITTLEKLKGLNSVKVQRLNDTKHKMELLKVKLEENGVDTKRIIAEVESYESRIISCGTVRVHTDGAARGNNDPNQPNKSAVGFAIYLNDTLFYQEARYIGAVTPIPLTKLQLEQGEEPMEVVATNNTSEYLAIIAALEYLLENGYSSKKIEIFSDSNVVVQQINMTNAARAAHLIQLRNVARELLNEFDNIRISHVLRSESAYVDKIVNDVLDAQERSDLNV